MRLLRLLSCALPVALAVLLPTFSPNAAAKDLPSDICSLLSQQQLQKTLGVAFDAAQKSSAPPAYRGQSAGTNCHYNEQKNGRKEVILIVYVDHSPDEAKQTFEKLSFFYRPKSKPSGIGDSAYIDAQSAIHVLKGKVRYFINAGDVSEKQIEALATAVAGQI